MRTRTQAASRRSATGRRLGSSVTDSRSSAIGHRGWNGQPLGRCGRVGWVAAETARSHPRRRVADRREGRRRAPTCRGAAGGRTRRRSGPSSTIRPAYMTARSSHTSVSTDRSWVMKIIDRPGSRPQRCEECEHLGLHHHVERGRRLVGDQQLGVARQRHGDQHALALPARQLVRVGRRRSAGRPTCSSSSADTSDAAALDRSRSDGAASARRSARPIRCTGLSAWSAPWNTIAPSVHRTERSRPGFIVSTSLAVEHHRPVDLGAGRAATAGSRAPSSTCRTRTRRPARATAPLDDERHAAHRRARRPTRCGSVTAEVVDLRAAVRSSPLAQSGVGDLFQRLADQREGEHHEQDPDAGRARSTTTRCG